MAVTGMEILSIQADWSVAKGLSLAPEAVKTTFFTFYFICL
jgi:hypothetical protein